MQYLLSRIDQSICIGELLKRVVADYALQEVVQFEPIETGYEELNIKLATPRGRYVVKIFSKDKKFSTIQDYIRGLIEFSNAGIPVPKLLEYRDGFLYNAVGGSGDVYLCVMEFFEGKPFTEIEPSEDDCKELAGYLSKIHRLSFSVKLNYDSWGTEHLIEEFESKGKYLCEEDYRIVSPVVEVFRAIDFTKFRKCTVHGDLQRNNILKDPQGNYCILDLGTMTFAPAAIDLAIFLAAFCFDLHSVWKNRKTYNLVINKYQERTALNPVELLSLPILIKATYAIYLIASNYRHVAKNDGSGQTKKWLALSRKGLEMFSQYQLRLD